MDASTLLSGLVSASNVKKIGTASGASSADVKNVLGQALPVLLQSASGQATGSTAAGFTQALADHASAKTSSIDMADGAKIISHLLGKKESTTTTQIAKAAGVTKKAAPVKKTAAPKAASAPAEAAKPAATTTEAPKKFKKKGIVIFKGNAND